MALQALRKSLDLHGALARGGYAAQAAYVGFMLDTIARLLIAASTFDKPVRREVARMPEGLVLGFEVLGTDLKMRLRVKKGRLVRESPETRAEVNVVFKHIGHAFMVFSFQESTAEAFAHQRTVTEGDTGLTMRFVRCLDRVQAISMPVVLAERALKEVPEMSVREKLSLNARLFARIARGFASRSPK